MTTTTTRAGHVFSRSAERYWLLRFEDHELRFTLREAADRWAAKLATCGIAYELTGHSPETTGREEPMQRDAA